VAKAQLQAAVLMVADATLLLVRNVKVAYVELQAEVAILLERPMGAQHRLVLGRREVIEGALGLVDQQCVQHPVLLLHPIDVPRRSIRTSGVDGRPTAEPRATATAPQDHDARRFGRDDLAAGHGPSRRIGDSVR
jgi:hypothetical protein